MAATAEAEAEAENRAADSPQHDHSYCAALARAARARYSQLSIQRQQIYGTTSPARGRSAACPSGNPAAQPHRPDVPPPSPPRLLPPPAVQFKHTEEELEQTVQVSRDAVSRALANMPALLTAGPKSRPATPEIAPASGGAWSSRAKSSRAAASSNGTSSSGPAYAPGAHQSRARLPFLCPFRSRPCCAPAPRQP